MNENKTDMTPDDVKRIEADVSSLKEVLQTDSVEKMKAKLSTLQVCG